MCGIAGFWSHRQLAADEARGRLEAIRDVISNRDPDDSGASIHGSIAFGHRRLSIVDLSPLGHQPMARHFEGSGEPAASRRLVTPLGYRFRARPTGL